MWFGAAELCVWKAHRAKMVFLCLGAIITVGHLSYDWTRWSSSVSLLCPSDLSTATILSSASVAFCPSSKHNRLYSY